jgi:hypothetical protein
MSSIKTTKINVGIYTLTYKGRVFEAERVEDGTWQLVEIVGLQQEYWNHFMTLTACKNAIMEVLT